MTQITALLVIVAVCFLATAAGFGKFVKPVTAERGEITSGIESELHKELTDYMGEWFRKHEDGSCGGCKHLDITCPHPNRCEARHSPLARVILPPMNLVKALPDPIVIDL